MAAIPLINVFVSRRGAKVGALMAMPQARGCSSRDVQSGFPPRCLTLDEANKRAGVCLAPMGRADEEGQLQKQSTQRLWNGLRKALSATAAVKAPAGWAHLDERTLEPRGAAIGQGSHAIDAQPPKRPCCRRRGRSSSIWTKPDCARSSRKDSRERADLSLSPLSQRQPKATQYVVLRVSTPVVYAKRLDSGRRAKGSDGADDLDGRGAWATPVEGGKCSLSNGIDLQFVFDNVRNPSPCRNGPAPQAMANQMARLVGRSRAPAIQTRPIRTGAAFKIARTGVLGSM